MTPAPSTFLALLETDYEPRYRNATIAPSVSPKLITLLVLVVLLAKPASEP